MAQNRGKQFEEQVKKGFEKLDDTYVLRLYDTTNGFTGVANPCDYVVYNSPTLYLIECKSCYGSSLPISNITDNQRNSLLEADTLKGIVAGYIIWFIDKDRTIFIQANDLEIYLSTANRKSIPWDIQRCYEINGIKRRILYDYDMKGLIDYVNDNNK